MPRPRMVAVIPDTPYSRLYIDTVESRDAIQTLLNRSASSDFAELSVDAAVFKNHGYEPARAKDLNYDPITASIWTAEIDSESTAPESFDVFQRGVIEMIRGLRARGIRVTASGDFEDRIAVETGWNWSVDSPDPPK